MTLRIDLIIWIILELAVDQIDVETAFLEGDLKEDEYIYLKCPDGMELEEDECLEVIKGMYGFVQASRIYWLKMCKLLTSERVGMKQCAADQCLFVKEGKINVVFATLCG